jgi:hypothetical protein
MKKLLTILLASAATFATASLASAEEVITLSDAELDRVTAAGASVSADLTGDAIVFGAFLLGNLGGIGGNLSGLGSFADVIAVIIPLSGVPTLTLKVSADTFD